VGESVGGAPLRATESLRAPESPPLRSAEFERNRAEVDALHRELRAVAALEARARIRFEGQIGRAVCERGGVRAGGGQGEACIRRVQARAWCNARRTRGRPPKRSRRRQRLAIVSCVRYYLPCGDGVRQRAPLSAELRRPPSSAQTTGTRGR